MKSEHKKLLLLSIFLFIIPFTLAATDIIGQIVGPLGLENIPALYAKYPIFIDAVFYFLFFIGTSLAVLGKMDMFKDSKLVPITIGVFLAIAMSVFSYKRFSLIGDLGPYALILLLSVCFVFGFKMLRGLGANKLFAFSIIFLLLVTVFNIFFGAYSPDGGGGGKEDPAMAAIAKNPTVQAGMGIGQIIAIFGVLGGLFSFIKFKKSGEGYYDAANNAASQDKNSWNNLTSDIKKGEEDALNAGKDLDLEKQKINDMMANNANTEKQEEYDLYNEKNIVDNAKKAVDEVIATKKGLEDVKNLPLEQQAQKTQELINRMNQYLKWLKGFSKYSQYLNDEKTKESKSIEIYKRLKTEVDTIQKDVEKIMADYVKIKQEIQKIDINIATTVNTELARFNAEINNINELHKNVASKQATIEKYTDESFNLTKSTIIWGRRTINIVETRIKTITDGTRELYDIEQGYLDNLSKYVNNLKQSTDSRAMLHNNTKTAIEEEKTLLEKEISLTTQAISDFKRMIHDTLIAATTEARNDINAYSEFKKVIDEFTQIMDTERKNDKEGLYLYGKIQPFITKMLGWTIPHGTSKVTNDIITDYMIEIKKLYEDGGKGTLKRFEDRIKKISGKMTESITREENKITEINKLSGV